MIQLMQYDSSRKQAWDQFISNSKNGVFLFYRDYMEYHSSRFDDYSIMFFEEDNLIAVMAANIVGDTLFSHGGLTFGGVVSNNKMKALTMLEVFDALKQHLVARGISKIIYKAIPHIYHSVPAEEDLYALSIQKATLIRRDISSSLRMTERPRYSKGRKWCVKRGKASGLEVERSSDFKSFMEIEEHLLKTKYNLRPVHNVEEMEMLAGRFPDNIKLFTAQKGGEIIAGVIVYENKTVAHAQYISANDEGKNSGALDLILDYLINEYYKNKDYFDFGISTENNGMHLNLGLIENKESFGARAVVYDFYEVDLSRTIDFTCHRSDSKAPHLSGAD